MVDLATTDKQFLRVDECVALLGLSRATLYRYLRRGRLRGVQVEPHCAVRIPITEVRRILIRRAADTPLL